MVVDGESFLGKLVVDAQRTDGRVGLEHLHQLEAQVTL